jgi:alpha-tubulin suppressor-like RCC1 family protein
VTSAFTWSPASPTAGQSVQFTDQSTGSPVWWSWSFGDNSASTSHNPTHTYSSAGRYNVLLTAGNATAQSTASLSVVVSLPVNSKHRAACSTIPICNFTASTRQFYVNNGTTLTASFVGKGVLNPGQIPMTSGVGLRVTPAMTTRYVLSVSDGVGNVARSYLTVYPANGIAAGQRHNLSLMPNGTVWAWGDNGWGQLGSGSPFPAFRIGYLISTPTQVPALSPVMALGSNGDHHSVVLKTDGTVWVWGANFYGQLGNGTTTARFDPAPVVGLTNVIAVAGGADHTLALRDDGTVWAWGHNQHGQLGDGTTTDRSTPTQVSGLSSVVAVAAGQDHSVVLRADGTVWSWGSNAAGQLGDATTNDRSSPVQVKGLQGIASLTSGGYHSLALKSDGTVWAWGDNEFGQLGDGTTTERSAPVLVNGLAAVKGVSGGSFHSLALMSDGTVRAWGNNQFGQMGDGTTTNRFTPVQVSGLTAVMALASGYIHNLALKADGTIQTWGGNYAGQLGDRIPMQR